MSFKEAQEFMAVWVAAIADNVKNPIASVSAVLNHAEANLNDIKVLKESINQIHKRLNDLNDYVHELANFSRPVTILTNSFRLEPWIQSVVQSAELPHGCDVEVVLQADYLVVADAAKLKFAVKALLRNAFEAVDSNIAPKILIGAHVDAENSLVLMVEDNGPGMPPPEVSLALEPFFTTKEAGTGLGLPVARKYVEAHGGVLQIRTSNRLGGCCVVLTLPILSPTTQER